MIKAANFQSGKWLGCLLCALALCGCSKLRSMGNKQHEYTQIRVTSSLQLPAGALPTSKRFDIPNVSQAFTQPIDSVLPPDYQTAE